MNQLILLLLPLGILTGCASTPDSPSPQPPSVGEVSLLHSPDTPEPWQQMDIGVLIFTTSVDSATTNEFGDWVFDEVRDNERHMLPFNLRESLIESNQWGAVRVLPEADPSLDIQVSGSLLHSTGARLILHINAKDSTGRVWLDKIYFDAAMEIDYPEMSQLRNLRRSNPGPMGEPFQDIYEQISNDLLAARDRLGRDQLEEIRRVSRLIYAADLSPESFADHIRENEQGRMEVVSLPAGNDPMLERVADMRERHHLFIDTVDEYYQALHEEMRDSYLIWRRYSFDQTMEEQAAATRVADQRNYSSSSGFLTLKQRYDRYRWSKIYEQEFRELASGFNREAAPAILELNREVHGLSGTMAEQYLQWRRILRQLFALENANPG